MAKGSGNGRNKASNGRSTSTSSLSHRRKKQGTGLDKLFSKYGLNLKTAQDIVDGATSISGIRPDKMRNIKDGLLALGLKPSS